MQPSPMECGGKETAPGREKRAVIVKLVRPALERNPRATASGMMGVESVDGCCGG